MPDTGFHVPAGLTIEGLLGRRYLARIIDGILLGVIVAGGVGFAAALLLPTMSVQERNLLSVGVWLILWITYGSVLEASPWQATLGKRWMRLRVCNREGGRLTLLQSTGRNVTKDGPFLLFQFLPGGTILTLILFVGHIVVIQTSSTYQAIHDRIASTWVAAPEETIQLRLS
jgi:uncharacterized RDD family membrane protein YckC